jgi:hypothetical protein
MAKSNELPDGVFSESGTPADNVEAFQFTLDSLSPTRRDQLAGRLSAFKVWWRECPLDEWPAEWITRQELDLSQSPALRRLPDGLTVSVLTLRNCTGLTALPENLNVDFLDISGCSALRFWPDSAKVTAGRVVARDCAALEKLPATLGPLAGFDLSGCSRIDFIPPGVDVRSFLDVSGTGITAKPAHLKNVGLRWRGVAVNSRIAFSPQTLTAEETLKEPNAEVRRVMIERMGFERFLRDADATVIHTDSDAGGKRQLLRVALANDEPLVVVSVNCPSTGRHYLIRVPPTMQTCHQAVAWTAGFDNPDDYRPLAET